MTKTSLKFTFLLFFAEIFLMKWFDFVGLLGVFSILVAYFLLQIEKIKSHDILYSLLNTIGAGLIITSLCFDFNFSAFFMELFWAIISIYGIGKSLGRR